MRIFIGYHIFPHYRKAIISALQSNFDVVCASSSIDSFEGIKTIPKSFFNKHIESPFFRILGIYFQPKMLSSALFGDFDVYIYLGNPNFFTTWLSVIVARMRGRKVYFWTHGFLRKGGGVLEVIRRAFFKLADGLLLYSDGSKNDLIAAGYCEQSLGVIYNSLDYDVQKKIRLELNRDDLASFKRLLFDLDDFIIVFIGRLTPHKKLEWLIELVAHFRKIGIKVSLLFIGDGPIKSDLNELSNQLGVNRFVKSVGSLYKEEEIAKLLSISNLCVSPGEIGLTAMHVMAYGVPVVTHSDVAHQMPEFEAVVEGFTGRLFKFGDFGDLCDVVGRVIDEISSGKDYSECCIRIIEEKYSPQSQLELIRKAIGL